MTLPAHKSQHAAHKKCFAQARCQPISDRSTGMLRYPQLLKVRELLRAEIATQDRASPAHHRDDKNIATPERAHPRQLSDIPAHLFPSESNGLLIREDVRSRARAKEPKARRTTLHPKAG